jgi:hypothetical protein
MDAEKRINDAITMARRSGAWDPPDRIAVAQVTASAAIAEAVLELVGAVQDLQRTIKEATELRV